jgi:two-component system nitrogen regulation sensor histidine kinase GlnL
MNELSFTTDKRLVIRDCSDDLVQLSGKVRSEIVGKKYHEVFPRLFVRDRCALAEVMKRDRSLSLKEYRFPCLQGSWKANVKIAPDRNGKGDVRGSTITIQPLTACSVSDKLNQSQQLIETGKIAAMFAHGVRNPLNAIKGAVVFLRDAYAAEQPIQEFTQIMEDEIYRLEHYVSQFLSSSAAPTHEALIDINALIGRITESVKNRKFLRATRCIFEPGTIPLLRVNAFQLEQALLNVINNAIEAMRSGGVLSLKTGTERHMDTLCIVVQISDTGPGIPASRISDLAAKQRKGKGFGLQIAYEAIKRLNGHLEITSKKDKGTNVRFFIPVSRPE